MQPLGQEYEIAAYRKEAKNDEPTPFKLKSTPLKLKILVKISMVVRSANLTAIGIANFLQIKDPARMKTDKNYSKAMV